MWQLIGQGGQWLVVCLGSGGRANSAEAAAECTAAELWRGGLMCLYGKSEASVLSHHGG